ncbi:MAG TPA: hypothetical protein VLA34_00435, partial [Candidatus Krumholzibacterium sp.]|nr:hypothetical protein [Candidatus Krumholzibacterium sp.]
TVFLSKNLYVEEDGSGRVIMTTDDGVSWDVGGRGLVRNGSIRTIAFLSDGTALAGISGTGAFRSRDGGVSWELVNNHLTDLRVNDIVVDSQDVVYLSGSYGRIFYSLDGCGSWTGKVIDPEPFSSFLLQCDKSRDIVYAMTGRDGFHCLSDTLNESTWIPYPMTLGYVQSTGIDSEGYLYIGGYRSILVYHPTGGWYFDILDDSSDDSIDFIYVGSSDRVFIATHEGRLFVSPGRGAPWSEVELLALGGRRLDNIFESGGCLYVLGWNHFTLYRSCDGERSWEIVGLSDRRYAGPMVRSDGEVLVHTLSSIISWKPGDELWSLKSWRDDICQQYSDIRGKLIDEHDGGYILSGMCGLKASWDGCGSWDSVFGPDTVVNSIEIACDGMVYVATDHGLLRSPDGLRDFECVIEGEISPYALVAGYDGALFVGT